MPNRLANETSPYLLQHANNPVDWYPWGQEALDRARDENKPILLSVGYSACHWCHVMERESFENDEIAGLMNDNFVSVKVDREERPDIDSIYMNAVQAMTGHGGWPMTVFMTPDGKPFYGGTYFPPEDRGPMPGFKRVLLSLAQAYREDQKGIAKTTDQLIERMEAYSAIAGGNDPLTEDIMRQAFVAVATQFDPRDGGVGMQPKFPQPMTYEFLLRFYLKFGEPHALEIVELTLDKMAEGGIYDQIGGGFHRYSVDNVWLVPHFEKMLYDNALLVKLYLHAYQVTGKDLYKRVVEETLDYVTREMLHESGGFYSAQDADSEGVEGKFFIWTPSQIDEILGKEDAKIFEKYYGVTLHGNFEGRNILNVTQDATEVAREFGLTDHEFVDLISRAKSKLLAVRDERIHPATDDKILTSWNGLMMRAYAEAAAVLNKPDYAQIAERNAAFICDNMKPDGRLLRTYKDGRARLNAYLEDYSFLIDGLIALHEVTFDQRWLDEAIALGEQMIDLFWDNESNSFYDTGRDHEELVVRPRDITDNAIPSGSSMAVDVLLRLAVIKGEPEFGRKASVALRSVRDLMSRAPTATGHWLGALDFYLSSAREIAVVGQRDSDKTRALLDEVYRHYIPNRVFVGANNALPESELPLLQERDMIEELPTAFVCEGYVCQLPVTDPQELAKLLVE